MKKLLKNLAVLTAVALLGFCFASCDSPTNTGSNDNTDGKETKETPDYSNFIPKDGISATFIPKETSAFFGKSSNTDNVYFYEDGTYISTYFSYHSGIEIPQEKGNWEFGNETDSFDHGTLKVRYTHYFNSSEKQWITPEDARNREYTITNSCFTEWQGNVYSTFIKKEKKGTSNTDNTNEEKKNPSPIKNFTVKQKEGTNFLIFSWEKLEGYDELAYWIRFKNGPLPEGFEDISTEDYYNGAGESFETRESNIEILMDGYITSGIYTCSIVAHEKPCSFELTDEELIATFEYNRLILTPDLEIKNCSLVQPWYNNEAKFAISPTINSSGNRYCMVYVGEINDIKEAKIAGCLRTGTYGDIKIEGDSPTMTVETFKIKSPFYGFTSGSGVWLDPWSSEKTYYMWLKLADEYVYDSEANYKHGGYIDSETYGPASNVVEFKFEVNEE